VRNPEFETAEPAGDAELRLLNGALDGDLDPLERERFAAAIESDPRFAEQFEQLLTMQSVLAQTERFEAPPNLKQRIMHALPAASAPGVAATPAAKAVRLRLRRRSILDIIASLVLPRPALALAGALIVGIVGGAALLLLIGDAGVDPWSTVGSVGTSPGATEEVFAKETLVDGEAVVVVTVSANPGEAGSPASSPTRTFDLDIRNDETSVPGETEASQLRLVLIHDPGAIRLTSYTSVAGLQPLTADGGRLTLAIVPGQAGHVRFDFVALQGSGASAESAIVEVRLVRNGAVVDQRRISAWKGFTFSTLG
jgi:hypothetical protein